MPTISIARRAGGWVDRARNYRILVDGEEVGRIGKGGHESFNVPPGFHDVTLKMIGLRASRFTWSWGRTRRRRSSASRAPTF